MRTERRIYKTMMRAIDNKIVPDGHYGPETCRWATEVERRALGLRDTALVHLGADGRIDCYFTETEAVRGEKLRRSWGAST
jgi:hypothetical protein